MTFFVYKYEYFVPILGGLIMLANMSQILLVFLKKKDKLMDTTTAFILNLSICDLTTGFLLILLRVLYIFHYENRKDSGNLYWEYIVIIENFLLRTSLIITTLTLIALTVLKLIALTKPYYRTIYRQVIVRMLVLIWILSILFVATVYGMFRYYLRMDKFVRFALYEKIIFPSFIVPSCFLFAFLFIKISITLRRHEESMLYYMQTISSQTSSCYSSNTLHFQNDHTTDENYGEAYTIKQISSTKRSNRLRQKQVYENSVPITMATGNKTSKENCRLKVNLIFDVKDLKLIRHFSMLFLFLWLPVTVVVILSVVNNKEFMIANLGAIQYSYGIALLKCVLFPIVYIITKQSYIREKCCLCWHRKQEIHEEFMFTNTATGTINSITTVI